MSLSSLWGSEAAFLAIYSEIMRPNCLNNIETNYNKYKNNAY